MVSGKKPSPGRRGCAVGQRDLYRIGAYFTTSRARNNRRRGREQLLDERLNLFARGSNSSFSFVSRTKRRPRCT